MAGIGRIPGCAGCWTGPVVPRNAPRSAVLLDITVGGLIRNNCMAVDQRDIGASFVSSGGDCLARLWDARLPGRQGSAVFRTHGRGQGGGARGDLRWIDDDRLCYRGHCYLGMVGWLVLVACSD